VEVPALTALNPFPLTSKEGDELVAVLEAVRAENLTVGAADTPGMFTCEWDRACLTGEYASWLASYMRSGWAAGIEGFRDDNRAFQRHWGFDPADARRVAICRGACDDIVLAAHSSWLADHIPDAVLHLLPDEGHISIGVHLPEIVAHIKRSERVRTTGPSARA